VVVAGAMDQWTQGMDRARWIIELEDAERELAAAIERAVGRLQRAQAAPKELDGAQRPEAAYLRDGEVSQKEAPAREGTGATMGG
jgi:hypothetical protein